MIENIDHEEFLEGKSVWAVKALKKAADEYHSARETAAALGKKGLGLFSPLKCSAFRSDSNLHREVIHVSTKIGESLTPAIGNLIGFLAFKGVEAGKQLFVGVWQDSEWVHIGVSWDA